MTCIRLEVNPMSQISYCIGFIEILVNTPERPEQERLGVI
jgi:hypothetical protein